MNIIEFTYIPVYIFQSYIFNSRHCLLCWAIMWDVSCTVLGRWSKCFTSGRRQLALKTPMNPGLVDCCPMWKALPRVRTKVLLCWLYCTSGNLAPQHSYTVLAVHWCLHNKQDAVCNVVPMSYLLTHHLRRWPNNNSILSIASTSLGALRPYSLPDCHFFQ